MKKYLIYCLLATFLLPTAAFSIDIWDLGFSNSAEIGQKAYINTEYTTLQVPSSFSGRTAKEWRNNFGVEFNKIIRYQRADSKVELRGRSSVFDFDYTKDIFDVQILKSGSLKPGANTCMDCHGGNFSRTTFIAGIEKTNLEPKPYRRGAATIYLNDATSFAYTGRINHWVAPKIMINSGLMVGKVEQGRHDLSARAVSLGLSGIFSHKLNWSGDLVLSKVERFPQRKTLVGKLKYRLMSGLNLSFSGGAFLDGYTQFGTRMSEMGMMSSNLAIDDPDLLPSIFTRFKDESFGYWQYNLEYEHRF